MYIVFRHFADNGVKTSKSNLRDVALKLLCINGTGGQSQRINIHHLQEIVMGSVCQELVPMKEPPNPFHHQHRPLY